MDFVLEDYRFLINSFIKSDQPNEAFKLLKILIKSQPSISNFDYLLFVKVFRLIIDPIRESLRNIDQELIDNKKIEIIKILQIYREKLFKKLENNCNKAINLIDNYLLINSIDIRAEISYLKSKGDFYRYLAENSFDKDCSEIIKKIELSYSIALEKANKNLISSDPVLLSTTLSYAIFLYDYLKKYENAIELLQKIIKSAELDFNELSSDLKNESFKILETIRANLINWNDIDTL